MSVAAERELRLGQARFGEALLCMRSEPETRMLVKEHLERAIDGSAVVVLARDDSDDRLVAATEVEGAPSLAEELLDADPGACLAVRRGRAYEQGAGIDPLPRCELCGGAAPDVVCTPAIAGGEPIGAVMVRSERPLQDAERERIADSVCRAAPVLANLRNLAAAESRAATDALTGLPNPTSCRASLERAVAHANRTVSPLSIVLVDLDRFGAVNERFGRGIGDDVLAAVGDLLRSDLRASDLACRHGDDELLVLLPGTDQDGAAGVSEKLRRRVASLTFREPDLQVTASFGVATYPLDALEADDLIRAAGRAVYIAKAKGRDRVERLVAAAPQPS